MATALPQETEALKSCIALAHSVWRQKNSHTPKNDAAFIDFVRALQNDEVLWDNVLVRPQATAEVLAAAATLRGALATIELTPGTSLSGLLTSLNFSSEIQQQLIALASQAMQRESRIRTAFGLESPADIAQQLEQLTSEKPTPGQFARLFALGPAETGEASLEQIILLAALGCFGLYVFFALGPMLYKGVTPEDGWLA